MHFSQGCTFWSKTTRSFKPGRRREAAKVEYLGTIVDGAEKFKFSRCRTFNTGEIVEVLCKHFYAKLQRQLSFEHET